jgi:hypothetical protein
VQAATRLGPYEILSPLGAGGMGEVCRTRDTRLGRDVAVKVLPEAVANHPRALTPFEREARAVACRPAPTRGSDSSFGSAADRSLIGLPSQRRPPSCKKASERNNPRSTPGPALFAGPSVVPGPTPDNARLSHQVSWSNRCFFSLNQAEETWSAKGGGLDESSSGRAPQGSSRGILSNATSWRQELDADILHFAENVPWISSTNLTNL